MDSSYCQLSPSKTFIVVGKMGTGKSTFVNNATGSSASTSSGYSSCTQRVSTYAKNGLTIVDTPGLSDPNKTDEEIVNEVTRAAGSLSVNGIIFIRNVFEYRWSAEEIHILHHVKAWYKNWDSRNVFYFFTHCDQTNSSTVSELKSSITQIWNEAKLDGGIVPSQNIVKWHKNWSSHDTRQILQGLGTGSTVYFETNPQVINTQVTYTINRSGQKGVAQRHEQTQARGGKGKCFSSEMTVSTLSEKVQMKDLCLNTVVHTFEDHSSDLKLDTIYEWLHIDFDEECTFLKIKTASSENYLELSGDHNLLKMEGQKKKFVPAHSLKIGDFLLDYQSKLCQIQSIESVVKRGVFAPLTKSGTLIVNGFQVSCYASTPFQAVGTALLRPLIWKQMLLPKKKINPNQGLNPYAKLLMKAQSLIPEKLLRSSPVTNQPNH